MSEDGRLRHISVEAGLGGSRNDELHSKGDATVLGGGD